MSIYNEQSNTFYVYAYLRSDFTPYYIGKGKGDRAFSKRRCVSIPKDKTKIIFLANGLHEETALNLEKYFIGKYGRKCNSTGILRNLTEGGEGTSGLKRDLEGTKNPMFGKKQSESAKMKISEKAKTRPSPRKGVVLSEETKKKISESRKGQHSGSKNPMYGKHHSEETRKRWSAFRKGKRAVEGKLIEVGID